MTEWKKVKIGDFLTEREGRYKPDDEIISQYQRLDKIDFSGTIHISNKPTKTDMILVQPGDLVISGINVAKGALTVYQGKEPVTATIHYSSYIFDSSKVNLDYFKLFVKSPAFLDTLKQQVKGGIKTEIKAKTLLSLTIQIPSLSEQESIVNDLQKRIKTVDEITTEVTTQTAYAKQLRQNILQDAIEGKLTADWRKSNHVVKGNPDFDAEALFEKIQEEKFGEVSPSLQPAKPSSATPSADSNAARNARLKSYVPITEDEKHFAIPDGWKWVRINQISEIGTGATPLTSEKKYYENGKIPWITSSSTGKKFITEGDSFITSLALKETNCTINPIGTLIVAMYGQGKTRGQITELKIEAATNQACASIKLNSKDSNLRQYVKIVFQKMYEEIRSLAQGGAQPNLNLGKISNTVFPLPPLTEQKEIVTRIESLLKTVEELETQIQTRQTLAKQLMQGILKDAFKER